MPERAVIPFVRLETDFSGLYPKLPHRSPQINHCLASFPLPTSACSACLGFAVLHPIAASPASASWVLCLRAGFLSTSPLWEGRLDTTPFSHAVSSLSCARCTKNPHSAQRPTYKHGSAARSHASGREWSENQGGELKHTVRRKKKFFNMPKYRHTQRDSVTSQCKQESWKEKDQTERDKRQVQEMIWTKQKSLQI